MSKRLHKLRIRFHLFCYRNPGNSRYDYLASPRSAEGHYDRYEAGERAGEMLVEPLRTPDSPPASVSLSDAFHPGETLAPPRPYEASGETLGDGPVHIQPIRFTATLKREDTGTSLTAHALDGSGTRTKGLPLARERNTWTLETTPDGPVTIYYEWTSADLEGRIQSPLPGQENACTSVSRYEFNDHVLFATVFWKRPTTLLTMSNNSSPMGRKR